MQLFRLSPHPGQSEVRNFAKPLGGVLISTGLVTLAIGASPSHIISSQKFPGLTEERLRRLIAVLQGPERARGGQIPRRAPRRLRDRGRARRVDRRGVRHLARRHVRDAVRRESTLGGVEDGPGCPRMARILACVDVGRRARGQTGRPVSPKIWSTRTHVRCTPFMRWALQSFIARLVHSSLSLFIVITLEHNYTSNDPRRASHPTPSSRLLQE